MAGEGLGKALHDADQTVWTGSPTGGKQAYDVVSVGDLIIDHTVPYDTVDEAVRQEWADADWFPEAGESMVVDDVPDAVHDYIEDTVPGGKGPNQAVAAAAAGAETLLLGAGRESDVVNAMAQRGVDTSYLQDGEPGEAYVFVEENGENRIPCVLGDAVGADDIDAVYDDIGDEITSADYVLMTNGGPQEPLEALLDRFDAMDDAPSVIYDPSPIADAEQLLDYDCVDIVTPNEQEYDALKEYLDAGGATIVRTHADGATVNDRYTVHAPDVDPEDTVGAGDTFNGYLAAGLSEGMTEQEAVEYAVHAASLSVTRAGAQPAIPDADEVNAFLSG